MKFVIYRMNLDMFETTSQVTINAKKGDNAYKIVVTLTEHGKIYKIEDGCYATFNAKKPDGHFLLNSCTIENNNIVYEFTPQTTSLEGIVECEINLFRDDCSQLTSPRFTLIVDDILYGGIDSESESNIYDDLVDLTYNPDSRKPQSGIAIDRAKPGLKTADGGEIFNDYENNVAGIKGYRIKNISVASDKQYAVITLNDAALDDKAIDHYSKDDVANLDLTFHHNLIFKISQINLDSTGDTLLSIVKTDGSKITEDMSLNSDDNWIYVANKSYGEPVTETFYAHTEGANNKAVGLGAHSEGKDNQSVGSASHTEGRKNTAGYAAHAEGRETVAQAPYSHTEGLNTKATGQISHAEGQSAEANGDISHAEGFCSKSNGAHSHAEGENTRTEGQGAHAEGGYSVAEGKYAHAQGYNTKAQGPFSHAGGENCIASAKAQTAVGKNNKVNDNALFIVGNGTTNVLRSNAFEVLSDGRAVVQTGPQEKNDVATKEYVDKELATFDFIKVVDELPETGLPNKIYLVPTKTSTEQDLFDEYAWINNTWEFIASKKVEVELTEYVKKADAETTTNALKAQLDALSKAVGFESGTEIRQYTKPNGAEDTFYWNWTKWNSGKAECEAFIKVSPGALNLNQVWSNAGCTLYYTFIGEIELPQNFAFVGDSMEQPTITLGCGTPGGYIWTTYDDTTILTDNKIRKVYFITPTAGYNTFDINLSIRIVGRWK